MTWLHSLRSLHIVVRAERVDARWRAVSRLADVRLTGKQVEVLAMAMEGSPTLVDALLCGQQGEAVFLCAAWRGD